MWPKVTLSPQMGVSLECKIINMFIFLNFSFYGVWGKGTLGGKTTPTNTMDLTATFFFFFHSFSYLPVPLAFVFP